MTQTELRKQISIFVPLSDWKAIRMEAARQKIPMTELCRRWMNPDLSVLKRSESRADEWDERSRPRSLVNSFQSVAAL